MQVACTILWCSGYLFLLGYPLLRKAGWPLFLSPVVGLVMFCVPVSWPLILLGKYNFLVLAASSFIVWLATWFAPIRMIAISRIDGGHRSLVATGMVAVSCLILIFISYAVHMNFPPGGDAVDHVYQIFSVEHGNPTYPFYYPFYYLLASSIDVFSVQIHAALLGQTLFLYLLYLLCVYALAMAVTRSYTASLYFMLIGFVVYIPFYFISGPSSHLWGVTVVMSAIASTLLAIESGLFNDRWSSSVVLVVVMSLILSSYNIMWIVFLPILFFMLAHYENVRVTAKTLIYSGALFLCAGYPLFRDYARYAKLESGIFVSTASFVLVLAATLIILAGVWHWYTRNKSFSDVLDRALRSPWVCYLFILLTIFLILLSFRVKVAAFNSGALPLRFGWFSLSISLLSALVAAASDDMKRYRWLFFPASILTAVYILSVLLLALTGGDVFFILEKRLFYYKGGYAIVLLLASLPLAVFACQAGWKKAVAVAISIVAAISFLDRSRLIWPNASIHRMATKYDGNHGGFGWQIGKTDDLRLIDWMRSHLPGRHQTLLLNYGGYYSQWFLLSGMDLVFRAGGGLFERQNDNAIYNILEKVRNGDAEAWRILPRYGVKYLVISQAYPYVPVSKYLVPVKNINGSQLYRISEHASKNTIGINVRKIESLSTAESTPPLFYPHVNRLVHSEVWIMNDQGSPKYRLLPIEPCMILNRSGVRFPIRLSKEMHKVYIRVASSPGEVAVLVLADNTFDGSAKLIHAGQQRVLTFPNDKNRTVTLVLKAKSRSVNLYGIQIVWQ